MTMLDALIIGGDGIIGRELLKHLAVGLARGSVLATTRKRPVADGKIPFDLRWPCPLPEARRIYFCTGINGFAPCEADPDQAKRINVEYLLQTANDIVAHCEAELVFLSSSAAETHPDTVYGTCKRHAEFGILKLGGAVYRFGPVCIPGRHVYPNDVYTPMSLGTLMGTLKARMEPGLHRMTTDRAWRCLCEKCA